MIQTVNNHSTTASRVLASSPITASHSNFICSSQSSSSSSHVRSPTIASSLSVGGPWHIPVGKSSSSRRSASLFKSPFKRCLARLSRLSGNLAAWFSGGAMMGTGLDKNLGKAAFLDPSPGFWDTGEAGTVGTSSRTWAEVVSDYGKASLTFRSRTFLDRPCGTLRESARRILAVLRAYMRSFACIDEFPQVFRLFRGEANFSCSLKRA